MIDSGVPPPGRNDPCPCGSGRKYKACCGAIAPGRTAAAPARPTASPLVVDKTAQLRPAHVSEAGALAAQFSPLQQVIRLRRHDARPRPEPPQDPAAAEKLVAVLLRRATPLLKAGKYAEAIPLLLQAGRLTPDRPDILHDLGLACLNSQRLPEAIAALRRATALRPDFALSQYNLGRARELEGSEQAAVGAYRRAVALAPKLVDAQSRLGDLLLRRGPRGEAAEAFQRAAAAAGDTTSGRLNSAKYMLALGQTAEAEAVLLRTIALDPTSTEALRLQGNLLAEQGRFDDAVALLDRAIALAPHQVVAYHSIVLAKKIGESERPLIARMLARLRAGGIADRYRMMLHFAAGKALDDLKDYAEAIKHFDAANRIRGRLAPRFDRDGFARRVAALIARFTPEFRAAHSAVGSDDETPVLIVGMPRSGTTLTEQIISSHPRVAGGGELNFWNEEVARLASDGNPAPLVEAAGQLAESYLDLLHGIAPGMAHVTDKLPFNFLWLGPVHLLFPRARIIHCRRNPIDTCLSIYSNHFTQVWDFSNDRGDLAFFYRQYERLMDHWRTVLPADRLMEVDYEQLTADPDTMTRRLIAQCGLEWDDACLRPEENQRVVKTASLWQARQPVYRHSVERWRNYEPWIGELRELLTTPA